jgi:hypothetical protein
MNTEVKGNTLIITVDLSQQPRQSKSAVRKALEKGLKPETVPFNLVDTSGGFIPVAGGKFKFSGNVTLGD